MVSPDLTSNQQFAFALTALPQRPVRSLEAIVKELQNEIRIALSQRRDSAAMEAARERTNLINRMEKGGLLTQAEHPSFYARIKGALLAGLASEDAHMRAACADALAGSNDYEIIDKIAGTLWHRARQDGFDMASYVKALHGSKCPLAKRTLLDAAASKQISHNHRLDAARYFQGCGDPELQEEAVRRYRTAKTAHEKVYFLLALGKTKNKEGTQILIKETESRESVRASFAISGLEGTTDRAAQQKLVDIIHTHREWWARREAAEALAAISPKTFQAELVHALLADSMGISGEDLCRKICPITDAKMITKLRKALSEGTHEVRGYAAVMLKLSGYRDKEVIQTLLEETLVDECPENRDFPYGVCAMACAEALGDITSADVVEKLRQGLEGRNSNISHQCAYALAQKNGLLVVSKMGSPGDCLGQCLSGTTDAAVIRRLAAGLKHRNRDYQEQCADALKGTSDPAAIAALVKSLSDAKADSVRRSCAKSLAGRQEADVLQALLDGLEDEGFCVASESAKALRGTRNLDVVAKLLDGLSAKNRRRPSVYAEALAGQIAQPEND